MSNYTKATNFLAKDSLATGDAAKIIKGSEFDTEFNALQTAVNSKANSISAALTGTPTAPTAASSTNTTQIATTEFVTTAMTGLYGVPAGGIIIWSGASSAIPSGWLLCNGASSTPDLRGKFVVGAGGTYSVAATGGSADAVVVSHTHTATVTDPGHSHTVTSSSSPPYSAGGNAVFGPATQTTSTATTGITVSNASTGVSGTNANLPPYYALCYIMKS